MTKIRIILIMFCALLLVASATNAQTHRGFYSSGISSWLGNTTKETEILEYAQGNGFNYINFYNLESLNWSSTTTRNLVASFFSRARTQYGVIQLGAVVEVNSSVINNILPYNNSRSNANERFNVINMEFEFWNSSTIASSYCTRFLSPNGYTCDTAGAWKFAWKQFKLIDSTCAANNLISEIYIGWPNKGQSQQLASRADRIFVHAYRPTDIDIYFYSRNRLIDIASGAASEKIITLLSSESVFMGPWLNTHPVNKPYQTFSNNLAAETGTFKQHLNFQGYHWFKYDFLPKTTLPTASILSSGPTSFCSGGSVSLTANTGAAYYWMPGGQTTQSITVSNAGSYTVRVTNINGVSVISMPTVVAHVNTSVTPTISVSGPTTFCPGGSVTLTSSLSGVYQWSNGATTQSITVFNSGNFSVTTSNGSCVASSAAIAVNANNSPLIPTISASGPTTICAGGMVTLTSSPSNSYNWSNGETTQSITVNDAGNYSVSIGYGSCAATSTAAVITFDSLPVLPVITPSGAIAFCPGGSVDLTSNVANNILWSTGDTTTTITVSLSGDYTVTTGDASCPATSDTLTVDAHAAPLPPVVTSSGPLSFCPGGTVTLTSSVADAYQWSNGANSQSIVVITPGDFSVTAYVGQNCFSTSSVNTVVEFPAPAIPVITPNGPTAISGSNPSVTLTAPPSGSYIWSTTETSQSIIVYSQGAYTVATTDSNGCVAVSVPLVITSGTCSPPPVPTISLNGPAVLGTGQSVTLTSSIGGSYLWSNGATTQSIVISTPGTFTVSVYNSSACFSTSFPVEIEDLSTVGVNDFDIENNSFRLFPNPAKGSFKISFSLEKKSDLIFKLIDVTGREIQSEIIKGFYGHNEVMINIAGVSRGVYFAWLACDEEKMMVRVVVE